MWYCLSQRFTDIIKKKNNNSNTYRELWFWSPSFSKSCETASKQNSVPIRARLPLRLRFDFKLHVVILRDSILQLSRIFSHDSFHERLHRHDSTHESPSSIMISCEGLSLHGYLLTVSCYVDFHHPLMIYSSWETIAIFTVFFFYFLNGNNEDFIRYSEQSLRFVVTELSKALFTPDEKRNLEHWYRF